MPLIYYAINSCLNSSLLSYVVVSTDDDEIALLAEKFGARVHHRPTTLGGDKVTLDPVIIEAVNHIEREDNLRFNLVVTVQPTSPLTRSLDIDKVIERLYDSDYDTILSATDDRHLCWTKENCDYVPEYSERVNRQQLPPRYRETGAIIACRRDIIESGTRIGKKVSLYITPPNISFDIDTVTDLFLCESILKRKKITFVVTGNKNTGTGHIYRSLMLANELVQHEISFIITNDDIIAKRLIKENNYPLYSVSKDRLTSAVIDHNPDIVINDILDTSLEYIKKIKERSIKVVNFEDLGPGSKAANLVFNALYPAKESSPNILSGPTYFCLRDEFIYTPPREKTGIIKSILLTFGGVDENNITLRALKILEGILSLNLGIHITIITGSGYGHSDELHSHLKTSKEYMNIKLVKHTKRISHYMNSSDLAITSGGRTVLELASLKVPTITICQNTREVSHFLLGKNRGIINMGLNSVVTDAELENTISDLIANSDRVKSMIQSLEEIDLTKGKSLVIKRILNLLNSEDKNEQRI
ncbi:CMP-N-acetylneuraminic acid synthetase [Hahella chejuensis KCTC 2396]|uniref:CMP-N-acetylneuraminic acid synthetase n=2 Tax=Hahella chejuensis TaxID=158327 RepID=Q2SBN5_HAHCH|nr:CMP-N-acetylneuraminic acid synthetase [Hahella chejuensis KCTC 2396]